MAELTRRYVVMPLATEAPFDHADPDAVFVLKPWKDPAALRALITYRENCYPELAADLGAWIGVIQAGPTVRGDVGQRNERHVKPERAAPPKTPAGGRAAKQSAKVAPPPAKRATPEARAASRGAGTQSRGARTTPRRAPKTKKRGR